ncbi:hypothetical protein C8J57DRAFT_1498511 [Mycena rebaudengoi]|nr:hypothetical protein C8J57DRAFT_1498511 [Mycena rebaudengoi]
MQTPYELVEAFQKSGEFDKLRRELLANAQRSPGFDAFKSRIEEIARERIKTGQMAPDFKELLQEVNRFPVVERFASEVPMLSEQAFTDGIRNSIQRILREDMGLKNESAVSPRPQPSTSIPNPPPTPSEHAGPSQPSKVSPSEASAQERG